MTEGNKTYSSEELDKMVDAMNVAAIHKDLDNQLKDINDNRDSLMSSITSLPKDKDIFLEKLNDFTLEELKKYLKKDENVNKLFTDVDGSPLEVNIKFKSKQDELTFKRDLMIYFKTTDEMIANIGEASKKLDEETAEINADIQKTCYELSDNILAYIAYQEEKASEMEDGKEKRMVLKALRAIKSGYTMDIYCDILDKYPSVKDSCKYDLTHENRIVEIGKRYLEKVHRAKSKVTLLPFLSNNEADPPVLSVEKQILLEGEYETEDLFIFSLIRHFAMEDWNDGIAKKAHASIAWAIKRLVCNDLDDQVKTSMKEAIVKYLKKFK